MNKKEQFQALVHAAAMNYGQHNTARIVSQIKKWGTNHSLEKIDKALRAHMTGGNSDFFPTETQINRLIAGGGKDGIIGPNEYCPECKVVGCTRHRDRARDSLWAKDIETIPFDEWQKRHGHGNVH